MVINLGSALNSAQQAIQQAAGAVQDVAQTAGKAAQRNVETAVNVAQSAGQAAQNNIQTATNVATEMVDATKEAATRNVDTAKSLFKDSFENVGEKFSKGLDFLKGVKDFFKENNSLGKMVGAGLDKLGLPDWASDFAGAAIDMAMMNPRGYEQLLSGLGHVAGEMGMDGFSEFLGTASSVTSMAVGVGQTVAISIATGGAGTPALLGQLGQVGQVGSYLAKAGEIAGHVDKALTVVDALKGGNVGALGTVFEAFGGNFGAIGDVLGAFGDSGVGEILTSVFGDSGDLLNTVFSHFGAQIPELPLGEILGQLGLDADALQGLAGPVIDVARELGGMVGEALELPGSVLFESEAAKALLDGWSALAQEHLGDVLTTLEIDTSDMIRFAAQTTASMIDMASQDASVAMEVMQLLMQVGSMSASSAVSDYAGAHIRC